jgi:hypothetical protein
MPCYQSRNRILIRIASTHPLDRLCFVIAARNEFVCNSYNVLVFCVFCAFCRLFR